MSVIEVTRPSLPPFEEFVDEIAPIWESRQLTNGGPKLRELEVELKARTGASNVSLFSSGHMALEGIIGAMGLSGEVITTPFTFPSTVHAIVRNGLSPVFADIDRLTYTIDPRSVQALVTPRTSAILAVHVFGGLCDVDELARIAERHGVKLVYDAAHAFGVERGGVSFASFGDATMVSFHATKVFNTAEGGAAFTSDASLCADLNRYRNFGILGPEEVGSVGVNAKMSELSAALGLCNLRHLEEEIAGRRAVFERYVGRLAGIPGLRVSPVQEGVKSNYAYFPVLFEDGFASSRDEVHDALAREGIRARKYFYPLVSDLACYRDRYESGATPIAAYVADHVLALPIYPGLQPAAIDRICDAVARCAR